MVSGQLELTVGRRRVSVGMGYGVFVEGETPYSYVTHAEITYISAELSADHPGLWHALPEPCVPLGAPTLIAAALAFVAHTVSPADLPPAAETAAASQRAQVLTYIAAHYTETELNVATLAADFGVSTRSLQRLFAGREKGVAEEIAAVRLHHALRLLRDPRLTDVALEEIAARSGFGTVSRMRRTIQIATGMSPRQHRAQSVEHVDARGRRPRGSQSMRSRANRVELPMAV